MIEISRKWYYAVPASVLTLVPVVFYPGSTLLSSNPLDIIRLAASFLIILSCWLAYFSARNERNDKYVTSWRKLFY